MEQTRAEKILSWQLSILQGHAEDLSRGREKLAIIEIVRSLDLAAVSRLLRPESASTKHKMEEHYVLQGAAAALRPFLHVMRDDHRGVPWQRSSANAARFFNSYLADCGKLVDLLRICKLERYGLARTSISSDQTIRISVSGDQAERRARLEMARWAAERADKHLKDHPLDELSERMLHRMLAYVDVDPRSFIRYDNDCEIVERYLKKARWVGSHFFEGEALPLHSTIGGRTFGAWKDACDQALGRILLHIDFAQLLCSKRSGTSLRDVLTIFAHRDDICAVWEEFGMCSDEVEPTVRALCLQSDDLDGWLGSDEQPTPMYVDLGRDFVLLPLFGALSNPYYAMFRFLRDAHRMEWDGIVGQRERIFRDEIRNTLPAERFFVPNHGFVIRRGDGSSLTDVDAVICDKETGRLALIQIKWHDIYGRSVFERESRRRNLALASKWVNKVSHWVAGRSSYEVARALGLDGYGSHHPVVLYVLPRYAATFDGDSRVDDGATWLSWPELLSIIQGYRGRDLLGDVPELIKHTRAREADIDLDEVVTEFQVGSLTVHLHAMQPRAP